MKGSTPKSWGLQLQAPIQNQAKTHPDKEHDIYLSVLLSRQCVTEHKLLQRLSNGLEKLRAIHKGTAKWATTVHQRRDFYEDLCPSSSRLTAVLLAAQ